MTEIELLTILKDISWAGVVGLIAWTLFRPAFLHFLNKHNNNGLNKRVDTIFTFLIITILNL